MEPLADLRGRPDRSGRRLQTSEVAVADEVAAAASLVMGQAAEGIPAVVVRGLSSLGPSMPSQALLRADGTNLFT